MRSVFFKDAPVNRIIIAALAVFLVQAALSMYYNNNALTFSGIEAFYSLNKAGALADMDIAKAFNEPGRRESDSLLYPVLIAPVYKLAGRANAVAAVYVLDLLLFAVTLLLFYKIALRFLGKEAAFISMAIYAASAPVELGAFSGTASALSIMLFAAALYFSVFSVEKKKYSGFSASLILMALNGWAAAVFAACFLVFAVMKANEKKLRKNYGAVLSYTLAGLAAASAALLFWVFVENFSFDYLKNNGMLDIKTWMVDAFFKDGFLWSKALPPFLAVFFYIALFVKAGAEIKKSEVSDYTLVLLLSVAALVMEFAAGFSPRPGTYLFMPQFFICLIICAVAGVREFSAYFELRKNPYFTAGNIFLGIIIFMLLYSCIYTFNRTIERNGNIQYIAGDAAVSRYMER
jgi:hypothetical protein